MQYRESVTSGIKQPEIEFNNDHVYVRSGFVKTVKPATEETPEQTVWTYNEYYMPQNEYYDICSGRWSGKWDDALRAVERNQLYNYADEMISKYSTDAADEAKRQAWIQYKAKVRATQSQPGYPQEVTYPDPVE